MAVTESEGLFERIAHSLATDKHLPPLHCADFELARGKCRNKTRFVRLAFGLGDWLCWLGVRPSILANIISDHKNLAHAPCSAHKCRTGFVRLDVEQATHRFRAIDVP